jgi:hypothetical protein
MSDQTNNVQYDEATSLDEDRRKFLAACGKFAVVTPPALTVLLSTSLHSEAIASSGGGAGDDGDGGHHHGDFFWWKWLENWVDRWF